MATQTADARLTLEALGKIQRAMLRGTITSRIHLRRLPSQIVLENATDNDLAWVKKTFPGGEETQRATGVRRKPGRRERWDEYEYRVDLRPRVDREHFTSPPRVEVWGIFHPHQCRNFQGYADKDTGKVTWRCGAYNCRKKITKTAARELGLLP